MTRPVLRCVLGVLFAVPLLAPVSSAALRRAERAAFDLEDHPRPRPPEPCGTRFSAAEIQAYLERLGEGVPPPSAAVPGPPYYIAIAPHIVRRSDGTGGLPESRYNQAIADANLHFAPRDMHFYTAAPIDYIDSDFFYYNVDTMSEIDSLRTQNMVAGAINVYFTENLPYCGISAFSFSSVQSILMNNNCTATSTNHSTFSHELGHFFDLFHTHETYFGVEFVDGSNCTTAGDLLCDTPADPKLSTSTVTSNCVYVGGETDPHGDPYAPDTHQLMSYSRKACRDNFSPESLDRAFATMLAERDTLLSNAVAARDPEQAGSGAVRLSVPRPNPASGSVEMTLELPRAAEVEVSVFDVRGARVRRIAYGPFAAGAHAIGWDGRSAQGGPAAPGIYFVRARVDGEVVGLRKIHVVR